MSDKITVNAKDVRKGDVFGMGGWLCYVTSTRHSDNVERYHGLAPVVVVKFRIASPIGEEHGQFTLNEWAEFDIYAREVEGEF